MHWFDGCLQQQATLRKALFNHGGNLEREAGTN
jgi:hypothetical protein